LRNVQDKSEKKEVPTNDKICSTIFEILLFIIHYVTKVTPRLKDSMSSKICNSRSKLACGKLYLIRFEVFHPILSVFMINYVYLIHGYDEGQFCFVENTACIQHVLKKNARSKIIPNDNKSMRDNTLILTDMKVTGLVLLTMSMTYTMTVGKCAARASVIMLPEADQVKTSI
jgi:hypothetical protein